MPRPRTCPHCKVVIPVNRGFEYDDNYNLICLNCDNIAFPSQKEKEKEVDKFKTKKTTTTHHSSWQHNQHWKNQQHNRHGPAVGVGAAGHQNWHGDY